MSLADAVKALKLVKGDLDKHKSLLLTKTDECESLKSQLLEAEATTAAALSSSSGPSKKSIGTHGLEYEEDESTFKKVQDSVVLIEELRATVGNLESQVVTLTGEKRTLKNYAKDVSADLQRLAPLQKEVEDLSAAGKRMLLEKEGTCPPNTVRRNWGITTRRPARRSPTDTRPREGPRTVVGAVGRGGIDLRGWVEGSLEKRLCAASYGRLDSLSPRSDFGCFSGHSCSRPRDYGLTLIS